MRGPIELKLLPPRRHKTQGDRMQYRTFGKLDWRPSALGFGAMRLPILDNDPAKIDEPLATRMIRKAIDAGVNYVDTARVYHRGRSELFLGRALRDCYRERVKVATKLSHIPESEPAFRTYLDEQLAALQTDHIDFYLLHGVNRRSWELEKPVLPWIERTIAEGKIGHLGFSFHDDLETFKSIVDAYDWTFCQIMYNYMDVDAQAGTEGLHYAASRGLAVVVMEPLRGGGLVGHLPEKVATLWHSAPVQRTPAEWALHWVWAHPEVSLLLSGMSNLTQVEQNLSSAQESACQQLTQPELDIVAQVRAAYRQLIRIRCTACQYCLPCPEGVGIPRVFRLYNDLAMYGNENWIREQYFEHTPESMRAPRCVACAQCEKACPQGIGIIGALREAHEALLTTQR
jgi:predicted aldo/keto reductase-like oxidoreductase